MILLALFVAHSIRFSMFMGTSFSGIAIMTVESLLISILLGSFMVLDKYLYRKRVYVLQALAFPVLYTLLNIISTVINIGNQFNIIGYFALAPGLSQNLSWLGEIGMTFALSLAISLISNGVIYKLSNGKWISLGTGVAICAGLLISGLCLSAQSTAPDYYLNVAVATREKMDSFISTDSFLTEEERLQLFESCVKKATSEGADMLVTNEEFADVDYEEKSEKIEEFSKIARDNHMPILLGLYIENDEGLSINEAIFFGEDGNIECEYVKNNLVPFIEAGYYEEGPEAPGLLTYTFNGHEVNIALVICFDINNYFFIGTIPDNTELLLVPSWDWDNCNIEQKRVRMRSIENNTTMLAHTYEGFTFASGPYGLCGDYIDFRGIYEAVEMIEVPIWEK